MNQPVKVCGSTWAMTLVELLVTLAIVAVLAGLLLPTLTKGRARATQINCVSRLKQAGLGFHVFAHDHSSLFPMRVSTNQGGTMEYVEKTYGTTSDTYFSFRHFQVLSDTLKDTKLVLCPADSRAEAKSFDTLKNENVSYFVATTAAYRNPNSILAGDRNITNNLGLTATLMGTGFTSPVGWTHELHQFRGNLLFADGRVEQTGSERLARVFDPSTGTPNLVVLPLSPSVFTARDRHESGKGLVSPNVNEESSSNSSSSRIANITTTSPPGETVFYSGSAGDRSPVLKVNEVETDSAAPIEVAETKPEQTQTLLPEWTVRMLHDLIVRARDFTYLWLLILLILALFVRFWLWQRSHRESNTGNLSLPPHSFSRARDNTRRARLPQNARWKLQR